MKTKWPKFFIISITAFWLLCFAAGTIALAQGQKVEFALPGGVAKGQAVTLPQYIRGLFTFGLTAVGITAMASIMIGGLKYMTSDLITTQQDAKDQIRSAIYGLLLLLFSWLILNTINPELVSLQAPKLTPPPQKKTTLYYPQPFQPLENGARQENTVNRPA